MTPSPLDPTRPLGPAAAERTSSPGTAVWVDTLPPPAVPGYEVGEELARGGMGIVYHARQVSLNRPVALKMLPGGSTTDPRWLVRFLAEAEAVAAIDHPHVVRVYEFGEANGRPFLAMEFLPGGTLASRLSGVLSGVQSTEYRAQNGSPKPGSGSNSHSVLCAPHSGHCGRLSPHQSAELVKKLAEAVAAAHALGIAHRDLKPGNVLFDAAGEPKVADFGLAKRGRGADLTLTGESLGTPGYMAPEQVSGTGRGHPLATDLWALGVILYECLTGAKPFPGSDAFTVFRRVVEDDPPAVRSLAPDVPRDLEHICRKCLEKDPTDRYPSADALAADLGRFLAGEPVSVRPPGRPERLAKWARRKPTMALAWALGLLAAGLTLGGGVVAALWQRAETANDELEAVNGDLRTARDDLQGANTQLRDAQDAVRRLRSNAAVDLAHREYLTNSFPRARKLLDEVPADLRAWEWRYVNRLLTAEHRVYAAHSGPVYALAVLPDARTVVSAGSGGSVRVWDLPTLADRAILPGLRNAVFAVAVSPDGRRLAAGGDDREVVVWDTATWAVTHTLTGFPHPVRGLAWLPDNRRLVVGTADPLPDNTYNRPARGAAGVWDADSGQKRVDFPLPFPHQGARGVAVSPDGRRAAVAGGVQSVAVFNPDTGERTAVLRGGDSASLCVAFTPDGTRVVAGNSDYTGQRWFLPTRAVRTARESHTGAITAVAVSPDGYLIASGSADRTVRVWQADQETDLYAVRGPGGTVRAAVYTPDGEYLLAAGDDGVVRAWPARHGPEWTRLKHPMNVRGVAVTASGDRVLTACEDGAVRDWAVAARRVRDLPAHAGRVYAVALFPDQKRVLTAGGDGTAVIWDYPKWTRRQVLRGHSGEVLSAVVVPGPGTGEVLTGGEDGTARLWDAESGRLVRTFAGHTGSVRGVAATADGQFVVTASADGTAKVWDRATGAVVHTLDAKAGELWAVAVSPVAGLAVTGHVDGTAVLWDLATGSRRADLLGHHGQVGAVGFSADGGRIFTGGADRLLKAWDTATGQPVLSVKGHVGWLTAVAASADGTTVVTGCGDESANVWLAGR